MSQSTPARNRTIFFKIVLFTTLFLFFLSPKVLAAFPQTAALAPAVLWVAEKLLHGFAVLSLVIVVAYVCLGFNKAYKWLTGGSTPAPEIASTPTPAALEAGTAPAPILVDVEVPQSEAPAANPTRSRVKHVFSAAVGFFLNLYVIVNYIITHDVVSLRKPALENAADAFMFVLRGLEVIFVVLLALGLLSRLFIRRQPAAAPASELPTTAVAEPVQATTAALEAQAPLSKEEKEFMEVEKA